MKNFLDRVQENGLAGRTKEKTEKVIGLDRRTREWNQMTALRFQTGGGGDIRHPKAMAFDIILHVIFLCFSRATGVSYK